MSWNSKVIWTEGLFLRPQHFQQHGRYVEHLVEGRCAGLRSFPWGFTTLKLDHQLLNVGKVSIVEAAGVFPDGTPFNMPNDDEPPEPMDVSDDMRDTPIMLSLPVRRPGTLEVHQPGGDEGLTRYTPREFDVRDATSASPGTASLEVGQLRASLKTGLDQLGEYACLGIGHLVEKRADGQVVLEDSYIPPVLDCQASQHLSGFLNELHGLLHHRGEALAGRVSETGRGGSAEIADFLLLQAVNRYEPLMAHLAQLAGLHPEDLYQILLGVAGEMATFTSSRKRPGQFPTYRHEGLAACFGPVMTALRESLSMVLEQTAIPIPMKERKYGVRVAVVADKGLFAGASFVLAVSASMPAEDLRRRFPAQLKIAPVEKLRDHVNLALPGIRVAPLPVAPRQIPYHSGFVYFELDRSDELWPRLTDSGGIGLHVGGEFPGIQMELWAIRGG